MLDALSSYGLSQERGFLAEVEFDEVDLPQFFGPVVSAAKRLSGLMTSGRIRSVLDRLPELDLTGFCRDASDPEIRVAMVRYSFLVQAYVWAESEAPSALPANLARPMVAVADRLDQAPLLPYSAYVLDNWARIDKHGPIALDNLRMTQNFLGGMDENWFVLVHVAIEARAGRALALALELVDAAERRDLDGATKRLREMVVVWDEINALFDRMPERCDPYVYYHRVRPYIHGWRNNPALGPGLIYAGVAKYEGRPQSFCGQTGSQSSIVPAMDALFGIDHGDDPLRQFLLELHAYRPVSHRRFIEDLARTSRLRAYAVAEGDFALKSAFNDCIERIASFRGRHLEYAGRYINRQAVSSAGNDTEVGTGGTPFMRYLKKHRDENQAQLIPL
jgi:indoleamine 2,3-dioxygenase